MPVDKEMRKFCIPIDCEFSKKMEKVAKELYDKIDSCEKKIDKLQKQSSFENRKFVAKLRADMFKLTKDFENLQTDHKQLQEENQHLRCENMELIETMLPDKLWEKDNQLRELKAQHERTIQRYEDASSVFNIVIRNHGLLVRDLTSESLILKQQLEALSMQIVELKTKNTNMKNIQKSIFCVEQNKTLPVDGIISTKFYFDVTQQLLTDLVNLILISI